MGSGLFILALKTQGHGVVNTDIVCPSVNPSVAMPHFVSYHIHVVYWPDPNNEITGYHNAKNRTAARRLRKAFMDRFKLSEDDSCMSLTHEGSDLCMMNDFDFPIGPWMIPQFAFTFHQIVLLMRS